MNTCSICWGDLENNIESYKTNSFQYQASIRQTIKKTTLGLIDKNNFGEVEILDYENILILKLQNVLFAISQC